MNDFFDKCIEWLLKSILAPLLILMFLLMILVFIKEIDNWIYPNPTLTLTKKEWVCTEGKSHTTMIMVGKVLVPENTTECVNYRKVIFSVIGNHKVPRRLNA